MGGDAEQASVSRGGLTGGLRTISVVRGQLNA
jgi:hypothetical protein